MYTFLGSDEYSNAVQVIEDIFPDYKLYRDEPYHVYEIPVDISLELYALSSLA